MKSPSNDKMVVRPDHYTQGSIECIDAIRSALGEEGYRSFLVGTIMKYLWRYKMKNNPIQDLEKGRWYYDRLIESKSKEKSNENENG